MAGITDRQGSEDELEQLQLIVTGPDGKLATELAVLLNMLPDANAVVDAQPGDPADAVIIAANGALLPTATELSIAEAIDRATGCAVVACIAESAEVDRNLAEKDSWPAHIRRVRISKSEQGAQELARFAKDLAPNQAQPHPKSVVAEFRSEAARSERGRRARRGEQVRRQRLRTLIGLVDEKLGALASEEALSSRTDPEAAIQRRIRTVAQQVTRAARRDAVVLHLTVPAFPELESSSGRWAETAIAAVAGAAAGAGIGRGVLAILNIWLPSAGWLAALVMAVAGAGCAWLAIEVHRRGGARQQANQMWQRHIHNLRRDWTSDIAAACDAVEAQPVGWRYRQLTEGVLNG